MQRLRLASFQRTTIDIVKTESFPALQDPSLIDFKSPLLSLRTAQVRVVILCSSGKYAKRLLDVAHNLRMVSHGWIWIVSDAIATEV